MKCEKCSSELSKNGGVCHVCVALMRDKYPCYTEQKIGDIFGGITRERVRQILKKEGRRTSSTKRDIWAMEHICPRCGKPKKFKAKNCRQCSYELHRVTLACSWCGELFEQYQSQVLHKISVHGQKTFFCNKKCQGKYVADHYGFHSKYTPEEAKQKNKEACKAYRESHKKEINLRIQLWHKHTNDERISIICSLLDGAKDEVNYRKLFVVIDTVFPGLFASSKSLRLFLSHHKNLFEVEKKGKVTLKGR